MKTIEEAAKENAHDKIEQRCNSIKCDLDCTPSDRQVSSYHTKCRSRYQERRDGFVDGVEFAQQWISVEDELPNEDGRYLVDLGWGKAVRVFNTHHECWDDEDGDDYFCDAKGGKVTYWRPIELK